MNLNPEASSMDGEPVIPMFNGLNAEDVSTSVQEARSVPVPPHRYTPLKNQWMDIYTPIVQNLKLQIRMNLKKRSVDIRTCELTTDPLALQKAEDFVRAFMLGFDISDALALLRMEDLFLESFDILDVKKLEGEHLARCIGRIAGKGGKTKFTIENSTRTRIVLADTKIHMLGTYENINSARHSICSLILGSQPGKVLSVLGNRQNAFIP
ncbi:hypothetical protein RCL1_002080 [Eukaryota sp. TZLM3-RCL]